MTDDEKISQRYRELGVEEPPRALDDAILAAARRRPQRSYAPLAAAAVLVLAVAVTLHMQVEQPGIESPAQKSASPRADQPAARPSSPVAQAELKLKVEAQLRPTPKLAAKEEPAAPAAREPQPFAADQAARSADSRGPESSVTGALARQMEERTSRDAEAAARAPRLGPLQARVQSAARAETQERPQETKPADTPERELERIAGLRGQGRQDEADRALAEFRKRYPDYRIPEEMRLRVERR